MVTRALVTEYGYRNTVIGVDFSPALIEAAKLIADEQGLRESLEFRVGDAQSLEEANETYDLIILHTVISHVPKPAGVISEVARILKPGGKVVFYDGDYASLTYWDLRP